MKKIFISGCFDLIHSGHIAFLKEASSFGKLYVGIGSDTTIQALKNKQPVYSEQERLYILKSIKYVHQCFINSGNGLLDFKDQLLLVQPDIFIVNEDGHHPLKQNLCKQYNIQYKVLKRIPEPYLPINSTTSIRQKDLCRIPYRLDLTGGWIDQPFISKIYPGYVITLSLEPTFQAMERCGLSTSTRNVAQRYWGNQLPIMSASQMSEMLFYMDNPPGKKYISGAQDAIGICTPGISRHYYDGDYWPTTIEQHTNISTVAWLEQHIQLIPLWPRSQHLNVLQHTNITLDVVQSLSNSSLTCWEALQTHNLKQFANSLTNTFVAQQQMFPNIINKRIETIIQKHKHNMLGYKLTGAGGGGYIIAVVPTLHTEYINIKIRQTHEL